MIEGLRFLFFLSYRFLTRGQNRFALLVTWFSIAGLALGVALLTLVVSVMSGFDHELRERLLSAVPHVRIEGEELSSATASLLKGHESVSSVHLYFQASAAVRAGPNLRPIRLYGLTREALSEIAPVTESLSKESLLRFGSDPSGILLGEPLARLMGLQLGEAVQLVVVVAESGSVRPRMLNFNLSGTFEIGAEPDYQLALLNLDLRHPGYWEGLGELGLEVRLFDPMKVSFVEELIENNFPDTEFSTWTEIYGQLFDAVRLEKSMMFLLLLLIVVIASFNVVAGQMMLVSNKAPGIAILSTIGAQSRFVRSVFLLQGVSIGLLGTGCGIILGLVLAVNINPLLDVLQSVTGMHLLDGSFFIEVPVVVVPMDLMIIGSTSFFVCVLSSVIPAQRAARLNPKLLLH